MRKMAPLYLSAPINTRFVLTPHFLPGITTHIKKIFSTVPPLSSDTFTAIVCKYYFSVALVVN